ncbi:MAG: Zn-ribbon domain-containing OB-fold protein [Acidimicrobiales bacterium]
MATAASALEGAACTACGITTFPAQGACPRCGAATAPSQLPSEGTLWSWTVQRLQPKPPFVCEGEFEPYGVGYVDLGGIKVEGRLAGRDLDGEGWRIGEPVHIVLTGDEPGDYVIQGGS